MTKLYQQPGGVIDWLNETGAAIASGDLVVVGHQIGVALVDIAAGARGAVALDGVFAGVPKVSAAVFIPGEKLLLDVSATPPAFDDSAATPASGDIMGAAIAFAPGANTETTCTVRLTPGNTTKTA